MDLIFLGTASNNPTPERGVSGTCFRIDGEVWLIDAGEGTQIQLMKSPVKPGKITKIFVTHLHGDHMFGLPGLMCTISQNVTEGKTLEVYGPLGLRRFIRTSLELSRSLVTYKYVVHELVPIQSQIPEDIQRWRIVESDDSNLHPSEILGQNIKINEGGYWALFENDKISVKASWIHHKVATFGFVFEQKPLQGKLDVEALKKRGVPQGPLYAKIKSGQTVELPDGTKIVPDEFIGPSRPGKKVTLLGDCQACSADLIKLAMESDVIVHEATLEDAFVEKALSRGHSTPSMAANVANQVNAKNLILSHFSQRYKPLSYVETLKENSALTATSAADVDNDDALDYVQKLIDEAKNVFKNSSKVFAAYDLWVYKV